MSSCITASKDIPVNVWAASNCISDHAQILQNLPQFFLAPFYLTPKQAETTHLSQNFVNDCPYCSMLHGELGRMTGLRESYKINDIGQVHEEDLAEVGIFASFGSEFGAAKGQESQKLKAIESEIETKFGSHVARATRGLSWFLRWGSASGNTLNHFVFQTIGQRNISRNFLFELIFFIWYAPLFFVIVVVATLLKAFPKVPQAIWIFLSLVLATVASFWIIPFACVSFMLNKVSKFNPKKYSKSM